jgi:hypothetical protein
MSDVNLIGSFGPKNRWQKKYLVADETASVTDIGTNGSASNSGFEFNGLTPGKIYKLTMQAEAELSGTSATEVALLIGIHNSATVAQVGCRLDSLTPSDIRHTRASSSVIFEATASSVTFNTLILGTGAIRGNNSSLETWAMIEELNNFESETADFT